MSMMRSMSICAVAISSFVAVGCSAETDGAAADPPSTEAGQMMGEAILHEFQAGEEEIAFVEYTTEDGDVTISLAEKFSAFAKRTLSDRITAAAGQPLTMLEMFYALAPAGELPHEALVDSHETELLGMERTDDSVLRIGVDLNEPVEKSVASCEAHVYDVSGQLPGYQYLERGTKTNVSGSQSACLNNDCGHFTEGQTRSGTCNETSTPITAQTAWGYLNTNNGAWQYTPAINVSAFQAIRWTTPYSTPKRVAAMGASGGTVYHLRAGVLFFVHP